MANGGGRHLASLQPSRSEVSHLGESRVLHLQPTQREEPLKDDLSQLLQTPLSAWDESSPNPLPLSPPTGGGYLALAKLAGGCSLVRQILSGHHGGLSSLAFCQRTMTDAPQGCETESNTEIHNVQVCAVIKCE